MLTQVYIRDVPSHVGREVSIKGWLYNKTHKGRLWFLLVRDGTGVIQSVLFKGNVAPEVFEAAEALTQESSLQITGTVRRDKRAPGGYELDASGMEVVQIAQSYPITPKEHGTSFLMDHRHLWLRSSRQHAILRIRHQLIKAARDFFDGRGFVLVDTPILTPVACEGTTNLFPVKYFDTPAYLSQSGQLYSEASCMSFGKVYCFGPTFRAEKSKTRRHLMEFWMVEPEVAYADLDDIMVLAEEFVSYLVAEALREGEEELSILGRDTGPLKKVTPPFPRLTYAEAFDLLEQEGSETPRGADLGGTDETIVSSQFDRPVMVHRYPAAVKGFYMEPDPENPDLALCMDMLAPEGYGEIIGGSQRIHDYDLLMERVREHGLPVEPLSWYLDLRRYGSVPHSGFGLGIERVLSWICGIPHVRETIPFPRMLHRLFP
ncbi:MAG: asparagine--tRNA ligase [Candidatus Aminicenantes bacterium]|nr:asparagine--tRNA ligase [Candidatus Aminicenantes bacterium]